MLVRHKVRTGFMMVGTLVGVAAFYLLATLAIDLPSWWHDEELPFRATWAPWTRGLAYAGMIVAISFIGSTNVRPFIYFQF